MATASKGKTLNPETVDAAEIVYHGTALTLPEKMSLDGAIKLLERRKAYMSEKTTMHETFNCLPWDGAHAMDQVLQRTYGWSTANATPGFFGDTPPKLINIEVGPGKHAKVPWGRMVLPNTAGGFVDTATKLDDGMIKFQLNATVLRKDSEAVQALFDAVREELRLNSIYRGKAIKMRFLDDDGSPEEMPNPQFIDTSKIDPDSAIFATDVEEAIRVNLFTPITRVQDTIDNGIAVKRGILLGGVYGTGKTLAASVASRLATDVGVTYLYVARANELSHAIAFARYYQSPACVVFCEDIDRVMDGARDVKMDDILNIIDGVDTKKSNTIIVLTTNELNKINAAMLRPGRLDAVIEVTLPDAPAVEKLLRLYGEKAIRPDTDLSEVAKRLDRTIPAVIAEVVKRAKLAQLALNKPGEKVTSLSAEALLSSANTMRMQLKLLEDRSRPAEPPITLEAVMRNVVEEATGAATEALGKRIGRLAEQVENMNS